MWCWWFYWRSLSFAFYRKRKYQNNLRRHQTKNFWFQFNDNLENHCLDLKDYDNALKVTQDVDYIFNFACNMGGWVLLRIIKQNA